MNNITRSAGLLVRSFLKRSSSNNPIHNLNNSTSSFKSAISLSSLYPKSTLKITSPTQNSVPNEKFNGFIPIEQLEITYSRSSGPGGQNVNKVNTKVDLRFQLQSAKWLPDDVKAKLSEKYKTKLSKEGYLIFKSDLTRFQSLNVADCLQKLRSCIWDVCKEEPVQSPETAERIRRRSERSARERLMLKRERSRVKQSRQTPNINDF